MYAVKKVRLKTMQSDTKIFREVNALSRLSHRNIVRYYTTWVETYEPSVSAAASASESDSSGTSLGGGMTSVPTFAHKKRVRRPASDSDDEADDDSDGTDSIGVGSSENSNERHLPVNGTFRLNIGDFDDVSVSRSSFPSIHFSQASSEDAEDDGESTSSGGENDDDFSGLFSQPSRSRSASGPLSLMLATKGKTNGKNGLDGAMMVRSTPTVPFVPPVSRTLYIQMEFVERQTLREVSVSRLVPAALSSTYGQCRVPYSESMKVSPNKRHGVCSSRSWTPSRICRR